MDVDPAAVEVEVVDPLDVVVLECDIVAAVVVLPSQIHWPQSETAAAGHATGSYSTTGLSIRRKGLRIAQNGLKIRLPRVPQLPSTRLCDMTGSLFEI